MGPKYGDASSVRLRTPFPAGDARAGHFQPAFVHVHFALDYIAENLDVPTMVLQYPSKRELIKESRRVRLCGDFLHHGG